MSDESKITQDLTGNPPETGAGDVSSGAFFDSLRRNNRQIREDRAKQISREAEKTYRRTVEDLKYDLDKLQDTREAMLDMSPSHGMSLKPAENFDDRDFVSKDINIGVRMRELSIKFEIANERYKYLFGKEAV